MLKAQAMITCPLCGMPQVQSQKEIQPGESMLMGEWTSLGFDMTSKNPKCFNCPGRFIRPHPVSEVTQVHTKDNGWVSLSKTSKILI